MSRTPMNEYGRMAKDHWTVARPISLARIPENEREEFFATLGEEAAQEVENLWLTYAGDDPEEETSLQKQRRLNMARLRAEEKVLAEKILLPEDPTMFAEDEPTWLEVEANQNEEELDTFEEWQREQDPTQEGPSDPTQWRDWHDRKQNP